MASGTAVELPPDSGLGAPEWIVVAVADRSPGRVHGRVRLAAAADERLAREVGATLLSTSDDVTWDGDVRATTVERLGAIVLTERPIAAPDPAKLTAAVEAGLRAHGLGLLRLDPRTRERLAFLHRTLGPPWPDVSDDALLDRPADTWLPELHSVRDRAGLAKVDATNALRRLAPGGLDLAPDTITVASGSRIRVDYSGDAPALHVKIQEVFGWTSTPTAAGVPIVLHLLSPAGRPAAVTADLARFWTTGYPAVRSELRGRYPKHRWPEDPTTAEASRRTTQR